MPFYCTKTSRIKMVAILKNHNTIVWYSPLKQNKKQDSIIIGGMLNRLMSGEHFKNKSIVRVQFYDNYSDTLMSENIF